MDGLAGKPLANFTPIAKVDSLQKIDQTVGNGAEAKTDSTVTVNYTGAIASSGLVFESSLDSGQPATLGLNQVIKGWTEGVPGMKVGGTRRLLIPAALAYGDQASATIPANSDLVFDITLIAVK
ncbi:FKBP-type peptidyl-prolyl cis-trans isomerase [Candidatus Saccharibacteria bacterium]|nr:FKBP-type peptidyl-prolyl cis-trans isomerase [Candidatus Saccharibacteria bacterium]